VTVEAYTIGAHTLRLDATTLHWQHANASRTIPFSDIRRIRLNAYSGENGTQYRLDVWPAGGKPLKLIVGSNAKDAASRLPAYAAVVSQLHAALQGQSVQYETGYAMLGKVLWALVVLAWGAAAAMLLLAPARKFDKVVWPAVALIAAGFGAMRFARKLKPQTYDPAAIPSGLLPTA
jgi:hypothetical protein